MRIHALVQHSAGTLLAIVLFTAVAAAAPATKTFHVPAGDAEITLREFSRQAGIQIIFDIDKVSGVRTAALQGEFAPREALDRMFAGTGLVAAQDEKTGALTVRLDGERAAEKNAARAARAASSDRSSRPGVIADRAPAADKNSKDPAGAVVLDTFVVNTDKDRGFMAHDAGTATKLGLDLKELAAPYSVMTGEFLQAMGITDLQQAAIWATNGAPVLDGQGADLYSIGNGFSTPSSMYFTRGVIINAGQQRNFFLTGGLGDTYNIERIDFGRGPNAVLFNVGANDALGGGISTVGKRARTDRNFDTIGLTVGSWDYYRGTLDVNRVLTPRLAVRGNAMLQKRDGWQQREFENRQGLTLAGIYRFRPMTELRIETVWDKTQRSRPPIPYLDNVSGWNGSTVFDGPISNYQINGLAALPGGASLARGSSSPTDPRIVAYGGEPEGVWREGGNRYVYSPSSGTVMNWIHTGYTRTGDENAGVPLYFGDQVWFRNRNGEILPIGNRGSAGGNTTPGDNSNGGGQPAFYDMTWLPDNRFSRQIANSRFRVPGKRFSNMPDTALYKQSTKDVNLAFTHQIAESLILDVQGDVNRVDEKSVGPSTIVPLRTVFIDLNRSLPNGQSNPHFLEGFSEAEMDRSIRRIDNLGVRAALGYIKDLGKWGRYTFNFSFNATARNVTWRRMMFSTEAAADPRQWQAQRIRVRYYQNEAAHPFWDVAPTSLFERQVVPPENASADNTYTTATSTIRPRWALIDWAERRETDRSTILAFAGRWFDNKLILSPGVRFGRQTAYTRNKPSDWGFLPADPNWDGVSLDGRYWRPDAPPDWKTLTYIPRSADGSPRSSVPVPAYGNRPTLPGVNGVNIANPLYANDRFRGDYNSPRYKGTNLNTTTGLTYFPFPWVAAKLNYATSFKPSDPARLTLVGDTAKPEIGSAYDVGLTFSLFHGGLSVTPRYYFNRKDHLLSDPPTTGAINSLMGRRAWTDTLIDSRNGFGYTNVLGGDYFAQKNDGYELELNGSITRGWRFMASLGTAQRVDYDRYKSTQAYVRSRSQEFLDVLKAAGGALDATQKPMNAGHAVDAAPGLAIPDPAVPEDVILAAVGDPRVRTNAINDYNNIWIQYDNINLLKDTVGLRRLSAKLVTDYTIQAGGLKGLRLGLAWYFVDRDRAGYRSGDTVANPKYDPAQPVSSTNRPWMHDPSASINTAVWTRRPSEIRGTIGYTMRLHSGWRALEGREIAFQLNIMNLLNERRTYYQDDGVALRPPNGDYSKPNRVAVPSRIASFQRPINFELTTTLKL